MKRILSLTLLLVLCGLSALSQDFGYGKINPEDFAFDHQSLDSSAKAIVLREYGSADIIIDDTRGGFVLEFYYHVKTKIVHKDGFDHANFEIPVYTSGSSKEVISSIKGVTYNLVNGKITESELDKSGIFHEKSTKSLQITKLTLPNIQEGSIIELKYMIRSPFLYNLRTWKFQSSIPKVYSEFVSKIPEICIYNINMRGTLPVTKHNREQYDTKMRSEIGNVNGTKTTYALSHIPAFVTEDYMTAVSNFQSAITFELASYQIPMGKSQNFTRTWADVEKQLYEDDDFGGQLKKTALFKPLAASLEKNTQSSLEKAKAVYQYINKHIRWDNTTGLYASNGVKSALEMKKGNAADVNLALIAALNASGISASPLILSTRSNGYPNFVHPVISDFNYVVASINIDSTVYLLDATEAEIPFGTLPLRCINFQGRLLPKNADSQWIDLVSQEKSSVSYNFDGALDENGELKGTLMVQRFGYDAYNKRKEIKSYNSLEEYFEKMEENNSKISYLSSHVKYLDSAENLLVENFDIHIKDFGAAQDAIMTFNPLFVGSTNKNPFNLESRSYPVDIGSLIEESIYIQIALPEGFKVKEMPKRQNMILPNKDARYLYSAAVADNQITITVATQINKPMFMPEEYFDLKEFFSRIIQSQKVEMAISKI
jgi:hypothetical protein